ncbi:FGGY family carbohydrate kinase [Gleimia hominis]|uniref:FGGY family carbohydrate kinase n=1 Tax=Gleimia hominis TaxID=595468 RepID=A0ABU3ICN5_9ACTO|nr:FGGY family carbohydrate kinase [Gleimia hominis]MDT3768033.1 FGGY family carbohydrate kinase [Gleimia hominis]
MEPLVIGIDSSTSATKAVVIDAGGHVLATGRSRIEFFTPHMHQYEHDPRQWWSSTQEAVAQAVAQLSAQDRARVKAMGITHQRETFVALDERGEAIRPAILWLDSRAGEQINRLGSDAVHELSGKPADTTSALYKMAWLKEHEPQVFERAHLVVDVHAYVAHGLTGRWVSSTGSADTLNLFDIAAQTWSPTLLDMAGVRAEQMPELAKPGEVVGPLLPELAAQWGLEDVVVVAGLGDGQAAGLGTAATEPGVAYVNIGTSIVAGVHADEYRFSKQYRALVAGIPGWFVLESVQNSGSVLGNWFRREFNDPALEGAPDPKLEAAAAQVPAGCEGLLSLPYWNAVQAPYWDPFARGAVVGYGSGHTRAHAYRSLLEGMAFELALNLEGLARGGAAPVRELRAVGGGSRSALWRQIICDVTGVEIVRSEVEEASAQGAAALAFVGIGYYDDAAHAASAMAHLGERTTPDAKTHDRYRKWMGVHRKIFPALQDIFHDIQDVAVELGEL